MTTVGKKPSGPEQPGPIRKRSKPSLPAVVAVSPPVVEVVGITRPRRSPSRAKLEAVGVPIKPRTTPSRSRMAAAKPAPALWTKLLVEAGVVDSVQQLGAQSARRAGDEGLLGLSVTARGKTALEAAGLLTQHLVLKHVPTVHVTDDDVIVVLQDDLGPRRGTVTCDIVVPRPLWEATDACRAASRAAAATAIPVMTLRRSALGESGTLLSLLVAPEDVDPGYDVACVVAHTVDVLRAIR